MTKIAAHLSRELSTFRLESVIGRQGHAHDESVGRFGVSSSCALGQDHQVHQDHQN